MSREKENERNPKKYYNTFETASFIQRNSTDEETNIALPDAANVIEAKIDTDANHK